MMQVEQLGLARRGGRCWMGERSEAVGRVGKGRSRLQVEQLVVARMVVKGEVVVGWGGRSEGVGRVGEGRARLQDEQAVVVRGVVVR